MNNKLRAIVIVVVTSVWSINMVAPIVIRDYQPSPEMHVAFMAIIGILTASYKMEKKKNGNDDDDDDDDTYGG